MKEDIFQEKVSELIQETDNLEDIEAIKEEFQDFESQSIKLGKPSSETVQFVFCFDNLGFDRPITGRIPISLLYLIFLNHPYIPLLYIPHKTSNIIIQ